MVIVGCKSSWWIQGEYLCLLNAFRAGKYALKKMYNLCLINIFSQLKEVEETPLQREITKQVLK